MDERPSRQRLPRYVATDPWLYKVGRVLLTTAARVYGRIELEGAGRLPSSGPALVVANHPSDVDPILVALPFCRTLRFMTDAVQFERPFVGWCIKRLGAIAIQRDGLARGGLLAALEALERGEVVAVFPEGDVYGDAMHEFETGVAFLATRSGAPLVPVAIGGAQDLMRGRWWRELPGGWRRRPAVRVVVGAPVCLSGAGREARRAASSQLSALVGELLAA